MKKVLALVVVFAMAMFCFVGCGNAVAPTEEKEGEVTVGDAAKQAILVVSFGTSYNETRALTIDAIEKKVTDEFGKDYDVRRAFTSQIIIDKLAERDGLEIDNVTQAMEKLVADGIGTLYIQPTHVMNGEEYDELCESVEPFTDNFVTMKIGKPLLTSNEDYVELSKIVGEQTSKYITDEETAVVFMGHGTPHFANATYACLQLHLQHEINPNYLVGTVEGYPSLDEVSADLEKMGIKKVVLLPFMIVAGDHANNDMAGDEEDSWKTILKGQGFEVEAVLQGLGEYEGVQNMVVEHLRDAIEGEDAE